MYQNSVLTFVGLLYTAIEEEGYVCIFFGFGNTRLGHLVSGKILTEGVGNSYLVECHFLVGDGRVVIGKGYEYDILSVSSFKLIKGILTECSGDFSCSVGTEVEEYNGVVVLNGTDCLAVFCHNGGYYEFIGYFLIVRSLDCAERTLCLYAFALYHGVVRKLYSVVVVVSVHCIVAAHDGSDFADTLVVHFLLQRL